MNSVILFASVDSSSLSFSRAWWRLLAFSQKYRKAYTKGHVAGTWSGDMLQRQFSSCHMRVFAKKFCCGEKKLSPQHVAWNSAGLNSCVMKQGQNDLNFQRHIVCTALANYFSCYNTFLCLNPLCVHELVYCPCNMHPMRTQKRACPRFTSLQHAP